MGVYRAAATLLSSLVVAQLSEGFKANFPPLKDVSVLVVGASGRIGENVRENKNISDYYTSVSSISRLRARPTCPKIRRSQYNPTITTSTPESDVVSFHCLTHSPAFL